MSRHATTARSLTGPYFGDVGDWKELSKLFEDSKFKAPHKPPGVIFSYVGKHYYEGDIIVVLHSQDELFLVDTGWWSMGGPEWEPEVTSAQALRYILDYGTYFHNKLFARYGLVENIQPSPNIYRWVLMNEEVELQALLWLDQRLAELGAPNGGNTTAIAMGSPSTIGELAEVFTVVNVEPWDEGVALVRADEKTLDAIRETCPDLVIVTVGQAVAETLSEGV